MSTRPTTPIRIALCITELDPGGAERCLVELVERLDRRLFQTVVYCLGPRPPGNPGSLALRIEQSGTVVHCFGARRTIQLPRVLRAVSRQMALDSPQIVQSFLFHANVVATLAARNARIPHVVTGIRVAERRHRWHLLLARWTDRWVERHVCVSQSVREFSVARGGLPEEKLIVIPNGVDVGRFDGATADAPANLGLAPGRGAIVCIGRLDHQKGVNWLIGLMPQILAGLPQHDLLLVGSGPERAKLERSVRTLGLAERVHFLGYRPDVPQILAASDLLVLPSRWEGMPNVLLEAMAAGKPVVASDVEGVAEALGPPGELQIVPAGNGPAFVANVQGILQSPEMIRVLGSRNRHRAETHFDIGSMIAAYQRLYSSLVAPG